MIPLVFNTQTELFYKKESLDDMANGNVYYIYKKPQG